MRVNQTWQKNTLAKIDQRSGISRFDLVELFHVDYPIPRNCDCAIFNRRSIHRHDDSGVNDHSLFTTFRHAATKRLHASWQRSGTAGDAIAVGDSALATTSV